MAEKRTYADRAPYFKKAVAKRRRKIKQMLIEYKGGKCINCGYKRYFGATICIMWTVLKKNSDLVLKV